MEDAELIYSCCCSVLMIQFSFKFIQGGTLFDRVVNFVPHLDPEIFYIMLSYHQIHSWNVQIIVCN